METKEEQFSAQWALDLLEPTPLDHSNHWIKYFMVPFSSFTFVQGVRYWNYYNQRPKNANLPYMVIACVTGALFGYSAHKIGDIKAARQDAVLKDYIRLHPDRFPPPENRKFSVLFKPWTPIR